MLAVGAIIMRTMKDLHEAVVSVYLNLALFFISAMLIACTLKSKEKYQGFAFFADFDYVTWLLIPLNGVNTVYV